LFQNFGGAESAPCQSPPQETAGLKSVISELGLLDWDFKGEKTSLSTHWFHPYPARFIPQIPNRLISVFTSPGETVYDPFMGSGTACVEANLAGRNAVGNDINPLSVLMAKVKTHPLNKELNELPGFEQAIKERIAAGETADIPEAVAQDWFEDFAIREIGVIYQEIMLLKNPDIRDFCLIALSSILVTVSKQDSDTRYTRVAKNIAPMDVLKKYVLRLDKMVSTMRIWHERLALGTTTARVGNSKQAGIFPDDAADFAVTSPPYPNAYDYHLYHKHRMLWLGFDPIKVKHSEIGAHAHYSRAKGMTSDDFQQDMMEVFKSTGKVLKSGKCFAVVIGNSIIRGVPVDNSAILTAVAHGSKFENIGHFTRNLDSRRKSFNPAHSNIVSEKIMIFRNTK